MDETTYQIYGRVFPDPQGCRRGLPLSSPWAKGNVCAVDFIQWDEALAGVRFLQQRFPRYIQLVNLRELKGEEFRSAGLPREDLTRDRRDLYVVKVTDAMSPIPEAQRKHFAYGMGMHGIERAGVEGGLRAAEDLVTWAACESNADAAPACATEGPFPKRILEPTDSGPTAGDVLRNGVVYLIFANPDGWARGDLASGGVAYQRYNGNGMDVNRDWPSVGFTDKQYTPWSEPESRGYGAYLREVRERTANDRFAGAIDLHGMLTARSFSFTLLGAGQRDYRKNALTVQTAITTFRDSEKRLSWSPLIAPAESCPGPIEEPTGVAGGNVPMCSDQWGTVWDTIDYQVTGALGDWMDAPIGLDAVGIDNEMALSHLSNCGTGTCFVPEVEQLHVDGNKGLIYAQISSLLFEKPVRYQPGGTIGYINDPARVRNRRSSTASATRAELPVQEAIRRISPTGVHSFAFDVKGPKDGVQNGGMSIELTFANARAVSPATVPAEYVLEFCGAPEEPGDAAGTCEEVARYFNQSFLYLQAGARIDLNRPVPGPYRLRVDGVDQVPDEAAGLLPTDVLVSFTKGASYPTPQQAPYDASRLDFFRDLNKYATSANLLGALTVDEVLADPTVLNGFDSIVAADAFMPGYASGGKSRYGKAQFAAYARAFRAFVERGGNLVLTDGALAGLSAVDRRFTAKDVTKGYFYAGWMDFDDGAGPTYAKNVLARGVDKEGTAEGSASYGDQSFTHRHQTYEPVPIGFYVSSGGDCFSDRCDSPNWVVNEGAWRKAGGTVAARTYARLHTAPTFPGGGAVGNVTGVSLGELRLGKGRIRVAGALLPQPTEANYHPFGLSSYAVTYTGYQIFENMTAYKNPARSTVKGTKIVRPAKRPLPATGLADGPWAVAGALMLGAALTLSIARRRA